MSAVKSPLRNVVIVLLTAIILWVAVCEFTDYLARPLPIDSVQELEVVRGSSLGQVIKQLTARNLLPHPLLFQLYVRATGRGHHILAGDYLLGPGTAPLDLLDMLEQGRMRMHSITLVEGWTLTQLRMQLRKDTHLRQVLSDVPAVELLTALGVNDQAAHVEVPNPGQPEGLFFPDTYVFTGSTSDRDILRQAYRRMQNVLQEEWQARAPNLPYKNAYEALIMASIVERETGVGSERPEIAGVFVRRLQKDMLLQTDPTVIYGLGGGFDGNLRRRDLDDAGNLYNTYQHRGLPPTPIALAGRAAIRAALQPSGGEALYFVGKGDGSHQFSATLDEHERAVKKYQIEQRRADYRSRPGKAAGDH
ncbi:MAG TPA: endolytic transglycosylase MltG [Spongiibacteraceae bacterium]|nr:endolytic transglycosylase MltG [Spongiibacteraceae bacterium]